MSASASFRCRLHCSSCFASGMASSIVSASSNDTASFGEPNRPAALMRGASVKARLVAVSVFPCIPVSSSSASKPGRSVLASNRNPCCTRKRFSPVRETTSATVAIAAKSPNCSNAKVISPPSIAATSFNASPAPQNSENGDGQSTRCGSTTATAAGSVL